MNIEALVADMSLADMLTTKTKIEEAIADKKIKNKETNKLEFLQSDECKKLLEHADKIANKHAELSKLLHKKRKVKLEIDVEIEATSDISDCLFKDQWSTCVNDICHVTVSGKLLNAKKYSSGFRLQIQDIIKETLGEVCADILQVEPGLYKELEKFSEEYTNICKSLKKVYDNYGLCYDDLKSKKGKNKNASNG